MLKIEPASFFSNVPGAKHPGEGRDIYPALSFVSNTASRPAAFSFTNSS